MTSQRDFELVLKQKLQGAGIENAKFAMNKIRLFSGSEHAGDVVLVPLRRAGGYYAGAEAYGGPIHEQVQQWAPPYKSRLLSSAGLSFNSLSEKDKAFGDQIGGTIDFPAADQIEATADKVVDRLRRLFVAPVTNYIAGQASVVDDAVAQPNRHPYPLATVLAVVALHPELDRDRLHQQITSTKELRPTNDFDRELLASL